MFRKVASDAYVVSAESLMLVCMSLVPPLIPVVNSGKKGDELLLLILLDRSSLEMLLPHVGENGGTFGGWSVWARALD